MTWAGRSRSRSLALPVSARTRRTSPSGNVLAITPRLMWSLTRMPAGRPAGARAIAVARPRASASMDQLHPYVNGIALSPAPAPANDDAPGEPAPAPVRRERTGAELLAGFRAHRHEGDRTDFWARLSEAQR